MADTTWVDTQNSEQRKAANRNLKKVKQQEKDKIKSGLIAVPFPIKKGAIIKYLTPLEIDQHMKDGLVVSKAIKKRVKKALKALNQ